MDKRQYYCGTNTNAYMCTPIQTSLRCFRFTLSFWVVSFLLSLSEPSQLSLNINISWSRPPVWAPAAHWCSRCAKWTPQLRWRVRRRWRREINWSLINNSQTLLKPILQCRGSFTTRALQQKCTLGSGAKRSYRWKFLFVVKMGVQVSLWLCGETFCFISDF